MKKLLSLLSIFTFITIITSCGGEEPTLEEVTEEIIETVAIDDVNSEETAADTSSTGVYQEEVIEEEISLKDAMKADTDPKIRSSSSKLFHSVKSHSCLVTALTGIPLLLSKLTI